MSPVYKGNLLRRYFTLTADESCPGEVGPGSTAVGEYSAFRRETSFDNLQARNGGNGDVTVVGYFQSWRYFERVASIVRREFKFKDEFGQVAARYLQDVFHDTR